MLGILHGSHYSLLNSTNMIGDVTQGAKASYNPSPEVAAVTKACQADYQYGHNILNKPWPELNDRSVIDDMNHGRMMFNAFVDEGTDNPAEEWKWRGTRSKARNKGIAMHASLTASYMIPAFTAQNESQELDRDMSDFMSDLVRWMTQDQNSNYLSSFLDLIFAVESDPIVYLGAEYAEVMQQIKIKQEDGTYTKKEILDDVLSGFKAPIWTADQILVSNAYERNLQVHRRLIKRRWIEYSEAQAIYGEHEYWSSVQAGFKTVYNADDGLFYEIKDDDHPNLVEEVKIMGRREDLEIPFVGGIYMGESNVDGNPMKHRDNFNAPRYNVQQFGFYPIGSHFLFYKSMMNAMRWDNQLYDAMSEIVMNRAILEVDFPVAISGADKFDEDIVFPNAVVTFSDKDTKATPLLPASNMSAGFAALKETEGSIEEGTISEVSAGQLPAASQKAFTVAQASANAKKMIMDVAKGIAISVARYGLLMADIAITHLSVPEASAIVGSPLKYRTFLLPNQTVGGRSATKMLTFDPSLMGLNMSDAQEEEANLKLLEEKGLYPNAREHLYKANPEIFAARKYTATADYEELTMGSREQQQGMLSALYAQLNADPMIERETLLRELMRSYFRSNADDYIAKKPMAGMQGLPAQVEGANPTAVASAAQNKLSTGTPTPTVVQ